MGNVWMALILRKNDKKVRLKRTSLEIILGQNDNLR